MMTSVMMLSPEFAVCRLPNGNESRLASVPLGPRDGR